MQILVLKKVRGRLRLLKVTKNNDTKRSPLCQKWQILIKMHFFNMLKTQIYVKNWNFRKFRKTGTQKSQIWVSENDKFCIPKTALIWLSFRRSKNGGDPKKVTRNWSSGADFGSRAELIPGGVKKWPLWPFKNCSLSFRMRDASLRNQCERSRQKNELDKRCFFYHL